MIYGSKLIMGIDYLMIVCCFSENKGWPSISTLIFSESFQNPFHFPKNLRIEQGLSASGGLIQKIYEVGPLTCSKCQWKNSPIFSVRVPISCGISYALKN